MNAMLLYNRLAQLRNRVATRRKCRQLRSDAGIPAPPEVCWKSYFRRFCETHGEPVRWNDRLLFPDGWTYSCRDYRGPEEPPPVDPAEKRALIETYWRYRLRSLRAERDELAAVVEQLETLQASRSAPLQVLDDDGDGAVDLDLAPHRARLLWLAEAIREAESKLADL